MVRFYRSTAFPVLGAVGVLALLTVLLFYPLLLGNVLFFGDISLYFVPLLDFQQGELGNARIPLWNPYLLCGTPFIGNPQAWPFYPSSALLYFFSAEQATGLIGASHVFLAGVGTLLFLRRRGLGTGASLVGAVAWCCGGVFVAKMQFPNMVQSATYLPYLLWGIEGVLSARHGVRAGHSSVLALLVGLSLLAAHAQVFLLNFYLALPWLVWRVGLPTNRERCRTYLPFVFILALGAGLACVQLLPVVEFTRVTVRADLTLAEANRFILPPYTSLYNFLVPNFFGNPATNVPYIARGNFWETVAYIGLLPFALAISAIFCLWRQSAEARFWAIAAMACCWLALGADAYLFAGAYYVLPGVRLFHDPARWLLPGTFALACLAAHGADALVRNLGSAVKRRVFLALILAGTSADLLPFSASLNPTTPREVFEVARTGLPSGRTYLSNYGELWGEFVSFRTYEAVRSREQITRFLSSQAPNLPVLRRQPMLLSYEPVRRSDIDRYLGALKDSSNQETLLAAAGVTQWQRYRDTGYETRVIAGHRAVFWNSWQTAETDADALTMILREDWSGEPIVGGTATGNPASESVGEPLDVQNNTPQSVVVSRRDGNPFEKGLVVLHDTHGAGWTVRVDGNPGNLRTVNGIFKGLLVPQGTRQVHFRYEPMSFRFGLFVSLCGAGILSSVLACAIASRYWEREQRRSVGEGRGRNHREGKRWRT